MGTTVAAQTGFMAWFSSYGQVVYIFTQMAFWIVLGIAGIYAAIKYAQYVDFTIGKKATPKAEKAIGNAADVVIEADQESAE